MWICIITPFLLAKGLIHLFFISLLADLAEFPKMCFYLHIFLTYEVVIRCQTIAKCIFVLTFQKKTINCICKYKLLPLIPNIIMNSCWLYAIITKTELLFMLKIHLALSKILVHQNYNSNTGVYRLWVWFFFFYNNSINRKNSHLTFWPPTLV